MTSIKIDRLTGDNYDIEDTYASNIDFNNLWENVSGSLPEPPNKKIITHKKYT